MAFKVSFFDNTEYDYFASDFNNQFKSIVGKSGVTSMDDLVISQTTPASLGVTVGVGSAWIDGMFIQSDTVINLDIPINSSSSARKDYIVMEIDKQNKTAEIKRVTSKTQNQLLLATILMENTNTAVVQGQITDNRDVATITLNTSSGIDWDSVKNKPSSYPPATHNHDNSYLGKNAKASDSTKWNGYEIWVGTQDQYDAISSKNPTTLYFIK